jgi:ArsR family transcriptional regulator
MKVAVTSPPDLFRAFADATRLRLLNLLVDGERCVCDLCTVLDESQPKVSRHLAYLRRAGLVTVRRDGKWRYYAVNDAAAGIERTLLDCVRGCLRQTDALRADLKQLAKLPSRTTCS